MSVERADVARLIPRISPSLAVTAWYLLVGGGVGPGQSGYLLDAFSVAHGDFVDDSLSTSPATCRSPPTRTSQRSRSSWAGSPEIPGAHRGSRDLGCPEVEVVPGEWTARTTRTAR